MELREALRGRHSIRAFTEEPVSDEVLRRIFEAAAMAPSALNSQPWHFHVARGVVRARVIEVMGLTTIHLNEYIDVYGHEAIEHAKRFYADLGDAPVIVAVSVPKADDELAAINNHLAAGAALENLLLQAVEDGVTGCNITYSYWVREQLAETFRVPGEREIVSLLLLGHPAEEPVAPAHDPDCYTLLD